MKKNFKIVSLTSVFMKPLHLDFSNPQKRKEFDRQRLQQQMREIQNIAGFSLGQFGNKSMKSMRDAFPAYPGADIEAGGSNIQQKNYATVSLCCLSVTNPFRNKIIQLVAINPWFDRFILIVILVNCFFLAIDREIASITEKGDTIDFVFLLIYTGEMILKIIAMGFVMRAHSYLRDTWNVVSNYFCLNQFLLARLFGSYFGMGFYLASLTEHLRHQSYQASETSENH